MRDREFDRGVCGINLPDVIGAGPLSDHYNLYLSMRFLEVVNHRYIKKSVNQSFTVLLDRVSWDRHTCDMPFAELRDFARRLSGASTTEEALAAAAETAFVLLRPSFAAVSNRLMGDTMYACASVGPYANHLHRPIRLSPGWQRRCPVIYEEACVPTVREIKHRHLSPWARDPRNPIEKSFYSNEAYSKECFPTLRPRSILLANVSVNGLAMANIGLSWKRLHLYGPYEREVLLTIASLLERALTAPLESETTDRSLC